MKAETGVCGVMDSQLGERVVQRQRRQNSYRIIDGRGTLRV